MMSVEIRPTADREDVECDFGLFENSAADPRYPLRPLMLITRDQAAERLRDGPKHWRGGITSVTEQDGHMFAHVDYKGRTWTWELYEASWWDGKGLDVLVGRWPD
jgi:hypothetical protein